MQVLKFKTVLLAALFGAASSLALAQSDKPLKFILPNGPGSGVDVTTRTLAPYLGKFLNQTTVVENQAGGGGIPGTHAMIRSTPDGNTISLMSNNHVVNPSIHKTLPYDTLADIAPITVIGSIPMVIAVHPDLPVKNLKELIALAKKKPGELTYSSGGNGTILHLGGAYLAAEAKIDLKHVPYRAAGQAMLDVIGGQVNIAVQAINAINPHIKSGKLRAIAVTTKERSPILPDVATVAEQGVKGFEIDAWIAAVAPAKISAADLKKLNTAFRAVIADPEVRSKLLAQGYILKANSTDDAKEFFKTELDKHAKIAKAADIKPD